MWTLIEATPSFRPCNDSTELFFTEKATLTDREQEVLRLICQGQVQKQIAYQLGIERVTVNKHLEHIREKLDAKTTAHAAVIFTQGG